MSPVLKFKTVMHATACQPVAAHIQALQQAVLLPHQVLLVKGTEVAADQKAIAWGIDQAAPATLVGWD